MKTLCGILLVFVVTKLSFAVSVDFYDEQQNNPSSTGIRLRINNDSNAPINDARLRYYYHRTLFSDTVEAFYLPNAVVSKNNVNDTLAYFELSIPSIPIGYYPDVSGFSLALHNQNWSNRDKTRDYSYQLSSSFLENRKVVLFSGDDVVAGVEPNIQLESKSGILKISGLKFSDDAWLEIKNLGTSTVKLSEYQLVDINDSAFSLGNDTLAVGEILRICQTQAACGDAKRTFVNSVFGWDSVGEAFLRKDSLMVSYVAWGRIGAHAAVAVDAGIWNDTLEYFPIETRVVLHNADYIKDTFFRLKPNKSGTNMNDWFHFTSNDDDADTVSIPLPVKTMANKPVVIQIPGNKDVLFSWLPVEGIGSYRVVVRDQNDNDVYNLKVQNTSVKLALASGNYSWTVVGEDEFWTVKDNRYNFYNIIIVDAKIDTSIYKQLKIHHIKARRDTKMLNLGYLRKSYMYSWDRPNFDVTEYELHESFRCWAIAIQVMNHFYGGNLTQDEIVYRTKFSRNDPLLSPFYKQSSGVSVDPITGKLSGGVADAMKWTLRTNELNYSSGEPSYAIVKNAIDNNKLVYVGVPEHAMVIYGYVGDVNNYAFYYAFVDNDGNVGHSLLNPYRINYYMIPEVLYGNVEMSDKRVHEDYDGDGITDFEEIERFHTNPYLADSDDDGIEDKREIYNYTAFDFAVSDSIVFSNPYESFVVGSDGRRFTNPMYRDFNDLYRKVSIDKDSVFAELDPDDDGDGIEDGLKGGKKVVEMDVPGEYTIFGREYVKINDGVKCYNTQTESESYCNLASADENVFSYDISYTPISIGARAHVGSIDVRNVEFSERFPGTHSNPVLRSFSVVHGNLKIYAVPIDPVALRKIRGDDGDMSVAMAKLLKTYNVLDYVTLQSGAFVEGNIELDYFEEGRDLFGWRNDFTYVYSVDIPEISSSQIKVVKNGETYCLKGGDKFKVLRVQSGGSLIVEPGEMFVDSILQIDANANVYFANPGKGTVLHTNGKIIWNTYNSESVENTQYWISVAKGFKLVHHSSQKFYIEGMWAGTIYAPKAKVIMGQVTKTIYGRVLARDVIVHQYAKVYRVDFNPNDFVQVTCVLD